MSIFVSSETRRRLTASSPHAIDGGRLDLTSFAAARAHALSLDLVTAQKDGSGGGLSAGHLVALAVLDDLHRTLLAHYLAQRDANLLRHAFAHLVGELGRSDALRMLSRFAEEFDLKEGPLSASARALPSGLAEEEDVVPESVLFDFILFWLQRRNPAARPLVERLQQGFELPPLMVEALGQIESFLGARSGLKSGSLAAELLAPLAAHPHSLVDQLEFFRSAWGAVIGEHATDLLKALDLIAEEEAPRWPGGGSAPVEAPRLPVEAERRYSRDHEWMPELVLAAKNTLVWLHQLSLAYGREIDRLDQIPEAEIELLAGRGVTGLWLIGLWERSPASGEIKRRRGNPEAASSAYSLSSYRIAAELGGEEALEVLRARSAKYGVRLAADMVPNHMGIDSDWVLDHPDRFVSTDHVPFPAYSFTGPDLSPRADVGIFLEDHYYDGTDAAVVFLRLDRRTGERRYIYHGNDGTSTPWNDTAQLDYLQPEVREAVMETILDVARRFPIIRFDAAMTLTKRHYHRLWHPRPGDAGAIPSRSEYGLDRRAFDEKMPREFWREVVDRVAAERLDTLLLAEAFWLMEGYFVRTLGLHRVYNSAFMHMMRDQETDKYRGLLEETLGFDAEILRRYVNFMSNPDEETAAAQFGTGDRYFGVCATLATLPGLPMFAHDQWDGLREKYGMEYRRSYAGEVVAEETKTRHDREIAPLLKRRRLFAGVESFRLYGFVGRSGAAEQDVLAYSNSCDGEAALVVFNNSSRPVAGRVFRSIRSRKTDNQKALETETVADALSLATEASRVTVLRDDVRDLSILVAGALLPERGLELELRPFGLLVLEPHEVIVDESGTWTRLAEELAGRAVSNPGRELVALRAARLLEQVWQFAEAMAEGLDTTRAAEEGYAAVGDRQPRLDASGRAVERELSAFLEGPPFSPPQQAAAFLRAGDGEPGRFLRLAAAMGELSAVRIDDGAGEFGQSVAARPVVLFALALTPVVEPVLEFAPEGLTRDELLAVFSARAPLDEEGRRDLSALVALALRDGWLRGEEPPEGVFLVDLLERWGRCAEGRRLLGAHRAGGSEWVVAERLDALIDARLAFAALVALQSATDAERPQAVEASAAWALTLGGLRSAAIASEYRLEEMVAVLRGAGDGSG